LPIVFRRFGLACAEPLKEKDRTSEVETCTVWRKDIGQPELGYKEWFRAGVEKTMTATSGNIPHEEDMKQFHNTILRA
jgi:hypothetical protein